MTQKVWNHVLDKYEIANKAKLNLTPQKSGGMYLFGETTDKDKLVVFEYSVGFTKIEKKELLSSPWLRKEYEKWKIAKSVSGGVQLWEDWISYESNKIPTPKLILDNDSSTTKMIEVDCPECAWTDHPGRYVGAYSEEPCRKCGGKAYCTQAIPYCEPTTNKNESKSKSFSKSFSSWGTDYIDYVYHGQDHEQDDDIWF